MGCRCSRSGAMQRDAGKTQLAKKLVGTIEEKLAKLEEGLDGDIIVAGDTAQYHGEREKAWFYNDCGYPMCIVLVSSIKDVEEVVKFAAQLNHEQYPLAVSAGKHSSVAIPDNAIVLDVTRLNDIEVDLKRKLVKVGAGCKIEQVDKKLAETGYGFATGTNGDTGVAGLTLNGGIGFLTRAHGFSCDNLTEVEIVLPNGRFITVNDENEYKDLMRALRGGGGNFGVVTSLTFKLHPVSSCFAAKCVSYVPTKKSLAAWLKDWGTKCMEAPREASSLAVVGCGLPVVSSQSAWISMDEKAMVPDVQNNTFLQSMVKIPCWFHLKKKVSRLSYPELQSSLAGHQRRSYCVPTGIFLNELDDETIKVFVDALRDTCPSKKNTLLLQAIGGKTVDLNDASKSCMPFRNTKFWAIIFSEYDLSSSEREISRSQAWVVSMKKKLLALGHFQTLYAFAGEMDGHRDLTMIAHDDSITNHLRKAKTKYDPYNLFHLNKNIHPLPLGADSDSTSTRLSQT